MIRDEIQMIAADAACAARVYQDNPGLVQPATTVDLYRTIERLALAVAQLLALREIKK